MISHDFLGDLPPGTPLTQIDFNLMVCEALGLDAESVARYTIVGTGEDVTVEVEWVHEMVKPGNPLTGKFVLIPWSPAAEEAAREGQDLQG